LFLAASSTLKTEKGSLVFFPGDVQDLSQLQQQHRDNRRYITWSLENTTQILSNAFPDRNIFTVRPARKSYQTFSCFENFVESDCIGSPTYSQDHGAIKHLALLLENALQAANHPQTTLGGGLIIVGFSKGVVVQNQILHELCSCVEQDKAPEVEVARLVWLDGGHNGGKGTSVTDRNIVQNFARLGIKVSIRVTPYQYKDSRRPWIHEEERIFYKLLNKFEVDVEHSVHFEDEEPSIEAHFRIIHTLESNSWD